MEYLSLNSALACDAANPSFPGAPRRKSRLIDWSTFGPEPEPEFDRITAFAARLLRVPVAYLTFVDGDRQFVKSDLGLRETLEHRGTMPSGSPICRRVVEDGVPLVVADARIDGRLKADPAVETAGIVACLGVPIRLASGVAVGALCAGDREARDWDEGEIATALDLAEIVSREIALRFEVARRLGAEKEVLLVSRELQHRARNAFSIVQAVISLSMRDKALVPLKLEIIDRIATVSSTQELIAARPGGIVGFSQIVLRELEPLASPDRYDVSGPEVEIAPNEVVFVGMIIHELTVNAVRRGTLGTKGAGHLTLTWSIEAHEDGRLLELSWHETGLGEVAGDDEGKAGFGSELLRILVTSQLKGSFETSAGTSDISIRIVASLSAIRKSETDRKGA